MKLPRPHAPPLWCGAVHEPLDVAIVGGGIAGLTTALALQRIGLRPRVFERGTALRSGKGGLLLWSNAVRVLAALGVGDQVVASGFPVRSTEFRSPSRSLLGTLPIDEMSADAGAPTVFIHRDALMQILASALAPGTVVLDHECTGFVAHPDAVDVTLSWERSARARLLVGADGVGSTMLARVGTKVPSTDARVRAWGGTATMQHDELPPGVTYVTIGRGKRFCFAPCGRARAFWFASVNDRVGAAELPAHFADFHDPIPRIIATTPHAEMFETRIRYRPPTEAWGSGRVTLLGDAIHPTTPDLAQGACQAIESAHALAAALRQHADHDEALRSYERTRQRRTARVTYLSWIATTQSMRSDPLFCIARDAVTEPFLRLVARRELSWLMRGGELASA